MPTSQPVVPETTTQKPAEQRAPSKSLLVPLLPRRRFPWGLLVLLVLGSGLAVASVLGTRWVLANYPYFTPVEPTHAEAGYVVGFGHVDVETRVVHLHPIQLGEIVAVHAREGQAVQARDLLLKVDDTQARHQVASAEAALSEAKVLLQQAEQMPAQHEAEVKALRAVIEVLKSEKTRAEILLRKAERMFKGNSPLIPKEEFDAAVETVNKVEQSIKAEQEKVEALKAKAPQLKLDIERAKFDVQVKESRLEQAKHTLNKCELRAPEDGTILRVLVSVGDQVMATPKEAAIVFCPKKPLVIRAEVQQEDAARVHPGQTVEIEDDARPSQKWTGEVDRVSDWFSNRRSVLFEPRQVNDVRTLECIIKVKDTKDLRIGQRVRVLLETRQ